MCWLGVINGCLILMLLGDIIFIKVRNTFAGEAMVCEKDIQIKATAFSQG